MKKELKVDKAKEVREYMQTSIQNLITNKATPAQLTTLYAMSEVFAKHKKAIEDEMLRLIKEENVSFNGFELGEAGTKKSVKGMSKDMLALITKLGYSKADLCELKFKSAGKLSSVLKEEHLKYFINKASKGKDIIKQK